MSTTAGVTQTKLADAFGVSRARISRIEDGDLARRLVRDRHERDLVLPADAGLRPARCPVPMAREIALDTNDARSGSPNS
jgi:predicted transcriptional regulator